MLMTDRTPQAWEHVLKSCGFRWHQGSFRRNGFVACLRQGWMTFEQQAQSDIDVLMPTLDRPGLWKPVYGRDELPCHEFQLPAIMMGRDSEEDLGECSPLRSGIEWMLATGEGALPPGWQAPPRTEVDGWIPPGGLSVQCGPFAVQGGLVCEGTCLKITFPLARNLSDQLSTNRQAWLRQTLLDAQHRWRLVRIAIREARGQRSVVAEVDLSGAPSATMEELFSVSLDALRWVVSWLICPVGLLADPTVQCDTWEEPPEMFSYGGIRNE